MNNIRLVFEMAAVIGFVAVAGCVQPTGSTMSTAGGTYIPTTEQGVMTIGLDDHDYDLVAKAVSDEMKRRGLPKGYFVALGPVDTKDCRYDVKVVQLQKSLQAIFSQEGTIKFVVLADETKSGRPVGEIIMKIKQYNRAVSHPADDEEAEILGELAKVNGILYGRVSCQESVLPNRAGKEIMYRFVWELTNTRTAVNDITYEYKIGKRIAAGR